MYRVFDQVGYIINQYVPELYKCKIFKDLHIMHVVDDDEMETLEGFECFDNLKKITLNQYNGQLTHLKGIKLHEITMDNFEGDLSPLSMASLISISMNRFNGNLEPLAGQPIKSISMQSYRGKLDALLGSPIEVIQTALMKSEMALYFPALFPNTALMPESVSGSNAIMIGSNSCATFSSGSMIITGGHLYPYDHSNNRFYGEGTGAMPGVCNATVIGRNVKAKKSNVIVIGGIEQQVGIRTRCPESALHINGGITHKIRTVSKNTNLTIDDYILIAIQPHITLRLPDPWMLPGNGHTFIVKNNSPGDVIITSTGDPTDFAQEASVKTSDGLIIKSGQSLTFANVKKTYFIVQH